MKITIIIIAALVVGFGLAYILLPHAEEQTLTGESTEVQQYTCGMHPEIISDEPGYCPICEMKLTPKKKDAGATGSVTIDPVTRQNMGLVTAPVEYRTLTKKVHAFGKVAIAEPNKHTVNLKIDGWVERLFVDHEGEKVYRGQPLLELYSPTLVAAQQEYLIAVKSSEAVADLVEAGRRRLANWDISDDQIKRLESSGEITRTMTILSPVNGVVISKLISEGDHLKPGAKLYEITDLSTVWVVAHIYEQDVPFVHLGQQAIVALPNTDGREITSTISYISPFLDSHGQLEIRLDIDNSNHRLLPEMYAEVSIESQLEGDHLTIPRSAVINSGVRQLAYVASGEDIYEPRVIVTGAVGDSDHIVVLSGLSLNELVVTSGQFLLDSESRLSEALAAGAQIGHDHGGDHDQHLSVEHDPDEFLATGGHDIYTCPMPSHAHVLQYGEGNCSECGMKFVPLEKTDNRQVYVCPMTECGTVKDHKDTCNVCGMNLVRYESEESHDQ
ncbi:MAG: efflux RND transporter periplasmic adaptor subunit [candidate division Zixibacteria bacterium]|nr:efflux RND transporter periplasmic adaptor subunit [candidate division Zixibacteria bacterium]